MKTIDDILIEMAGEVIETMDFPSNSLANGTEVTYKKRVLTEAKSELKKLFLSAVELVDNAAGHDTPHEYKLGFQNHGKMVRRNIEALFNQKGK